MLARAPLFMGSSSHGPPRRMEPLGNSALVSAAQAHVQDDDGGEEDEVMVYTLDDADGEDQEPQYEFEDGEEEGDEEDEDDDEDDDDEGEESLHYAEHYSFPTPHLQYSPYQPLHYQNPDAYLSDSPDASDDAGASLDEDMVAQLFADVVDSHFTDDVDMNGPADSTSDDGSAWSGDGGSISSSLIVNGPGPHVGVGFDTQTGTSVNTSPPATVAGLFEPLAPGAIWAHTLSFSNPNPTTIGPSNYGLTDFLHHWARQSRILQTMARGSCPWPSRVNALQAARDASIEYDDLEGDLCDFQGVDWEDIGVTRMDARERRLLTYNNYVNIPGSDRWTPNLPDAALPRRESLFRFRRMDIKRNVHLSHFQLRHVFASTSRSRVFYPSIGAIQQFNPMSGHGRAILKLSDAPASQISTLAAGHGVLIGGGFGGEYMLRHLDSGEPDDTACHEGVITSNISGITNHVAIHQSRTSSAPIGAFASNDNCFRVLDITTETWLSRETHDFAPNCTALSPDGRLRVMVGDSLDVVIAAAESKLPSGEPDILQRLSGHRDYGFACDWADDGWTIATASQDKTVKIWDARKFNDSAGNAVSVTTIRSEMAGARSLRFSPIGSGKRVLVAAEEADFINIIDAQTFRSKQTVDIFGELGGISFENGGQDLMVLCCDRTRGGILQLERCGGGKEEFVWNSEDSGHGDHQQHRVGNTYDWPRSMFNEARGVSESSSRRRRQASAYVELEPF